MESGCTGGTGTCKAVCTQRRSSGLTKRLRSGWRASPHSTVDFIRVSHNCLRQLQGNPVGQASCSATARGHTASQHP